ncbi:TonB-dependent receptor [uncultured Bacteroides sp.]|jgi:tonB-linked outer membrane protein, susC/ragA family|uniref:SusC/RagA family TonB-linked outer membrane protein n=1 Tax=uncultured Bacteroides sp. TaxID=162156 RepID=UPI00280A651D|nr:TonB-dependent receptor [uncultured Bacteroides sp.]
MKNSRLKLIVSAILLLIMVGIHAQNARVTGVVSDAQGSLIGVNVHVKGGTTGVITDTNGKYSIEVPANATLVFSYIGYVDQELKVGNKRVINVTLVENSQLLDEVVVVGYGYQRKSDVATSVASVKTDEMKSFPAGNVGDMLRGRVAGVNVASSSGRPGSAPTITIRGNRSISSENTPLYVIDGSVSDSEEFSTLSAESIESIEILKDAASQAIYGARASDGVILVTTKRGAQGKLEVNYNGYVGIQSLWRNFDFYSPEEYVMLRREAMANDKGIIDAREMSISESLSDDIMKEVWASGQFVDWEDLMLKNALYQNHDITIRGGTEKLRVSAGLNYFNQDGMVKTGSGYSKAAFRLNVDYKINKWASFGVNTSYALTKNEREDGNFTEFITRTPLAKVYEEDGSYTKYIDSANDVNPLYRAQNYSREITNNSYRVNIFLELKPFKGFNYRLNTSFYNRQREDGEAKGVDYPGGGATAKLSNEEKRNYLIENIFTYDVPIRNKEHKLTLTAVQSVDHTQSKSLGYSTNNLPVDMDWNFIANGEFSGTPTRAFNENNLVSFMGRASYIFKDRYIMNVAVRRDGSSRFGKNNKWGTFPSIALAWRINQEKFLHNVSWIDNLKLRLSYGVVGNQNGIGNYKTLGLTAQYRYEFGDNIYMGYLPEKELSNPNLKWEQSRTANIGVDFGFFRNRLSGTIEYYQTRTTDLLVTRELNSVLGYDKMLDNLGETKSHGVDISINGDVVRTKDFTWSLGANFSHYANEIVKIDDQVDEFGRPASQPGNSWFVGEPINVYYDYVTDGIYQYDDFDIVRNPYNEIVYTLKPTIDTDGDGVADKALARDDKVEPGSVKIKDLNGDGKINADDRTPISKDPNFTLSLNTTFKWKGFDFYMDWYGVSGRKIKNGYLYDSNSGGSLQGKLNGIKVNYWTPFNPSNEFPRPSHSTNVTYQSSLAIQDASYIRLRTLQLGYTFPTKWVKKISLSRLRVYATATNLLTFTDFLSYSPELTPGAYPESRQYVFGVNVSF